MLEMKNIKKIYRTELIETHALEDFSLHVETGEFVSIMGPSGSGKTTFLNVAGLLDTFDSGTYVLDEKDVSRLSDGEMSRIRNQNIGFVFQSFNLIPDLNVFDNVDVPLRYRGLSGSDRKRRIEGALELVGLTSRWKHLPSQLSGGQQQRVAIARAVIRRPSLLLADEPTGNVDEELALRLMRLFEELNKLGTTLLIATHNQSLVDRFDHPLLHLANGELSTERARQRSAS